MKKKILSYDICKITTRHPLGDQRIFMREATSLKEQLKLNILIIAITNQNKFTKGKEYDVLEIKKHPKGIFATLPTYRKILKEVNAKIFHIHDLEGLIFTPLLKRKKVIVVYDVHEDYVLMTKHIKKGVVRYVSRCVKIYEKFYSRFFVDTFILVTPEHIKKFKKLGIKKKQITIVANYARIKPFQKVSATKKYDLVYCGTTNKDRMLLELIDFINTYKQEKIKLHLILGGLATQRELLKKHIKKYKLEQFIDIEEAIPAKEVPKEIAKGRIGIIFFSNNPKYREGIPTKMTEYGAAGLPVIATDNNLFTKRVMTEYQHGRLVNNLQPQEIYKAYQEVNSNYKKMSKQAKLMSKHYSWEAEEKKLITLYKKLLKKEA